MNRLKCGECVEIAFGELIVPFSESPNRFAIPMKTIVWTFTLTEGLVKLGEINRRNLRLIREGGLKMGTLDHLASWVEFAELFDGSPNVSISPLISGKLDV
uniref:Uncharacterized protein n=1 Tax=Solanum tuberosum TaxID=4113 RepID=M1DI98_SOLTU